MDTSEKIILQTKKWITDVVVALNLCPFAAKEVKQNTIHYEVITEAEQKDLLAILLQHLLLLDQNASVETTLIIMPEAFEDFEVYLDLVEDAEILVEQQGYEGIYQIASFHPAYKFAESEEQDPSNFTNRSPYPMLHILREESIEKALERYPNHEDIPERNIAVTRKKGLTYMRMLRDACLSI